MPPAEGTGTGAGGGAPVEPIETVDPTEPQPEGFRQSRFVAPPGATTILLIRHGESAPAHPDRPFPLRDGHGDPELAPEGRAQAERLADRLIGELATGLPIDAVYVTTLCRTLQTAEPFLSRSGRTAEVLPELREVHLGEWEGGVLRLRAAAGDPVFLRVLAEERWDVIPGAEPRDDFDARLVAGVTRIAAAHPDRRVAAFAHGGVIGHLLARASGSRGFAFAAVDNASISELVVMPDGAWRVRRFNDTAHLA